MIDWAATKEKFKLSTINGSKKRPKVICICDGCGKSREITIRVKSKVQNNQMDWYCPSCVCLGRSCDISGSMEKLWQTEKYRDNQTTKKNEKDYKELQSASAKERWGDEEYRSKLEVGIRTDNYITTCNTKFKNQFEYDKNSFIDWSNKITITCTICGTKFRRKPLQHMNIGYCHVCNISSGQGEVSDFIRSMGIHTELNDRKILNGLELDIVVPNILAIEYNGAYWHSYNRSESAVEKRKHQNKSLKCAENNIRLIQIFDFQWEYQKELVKSMITNALQLSKRTNARNFTIVEVSNKEVSKFFINNHLQGHRPAKTTIALLDNSEIMMAASFSKNKDGYEIIRMATKQGYQVRGGASRIIKNFLKKYPTKLYTYADLMHSSGKVYETIGFKKDKTTQPGYFYIKQQNTNYQILSRQQCQKHRLSKLLGEGFEPASSEAQNMFNNGYRRVWTAGNLCFSFEGSKNDWTMATTKTQSESHTRQTGALTK